MDFRGGSCPERVVRPVVGQNRETLLSIKGSAQARTHKRSGRCLLTTGREMEADKWDFRRWREQVGRLTRRRPAGKGHGREPIMRLSGGSSPKGWSVHVGQSTGSIVCSPPILARVKLRQRCPALSNRAVRSSFPKSSGGVSRRQKQPVLRQHVLNRLLEPQEQRSFLPSFSVNSLLP